MPLTLCRNCGRQVSTVDARCPHCQCADPAPGEGAAPTPPPEARAQPTSPPPGAPDWALGAPPPEEVPRYAALARDLPGSKEAAGVILGALLALLVAGIYAGLLLPICAAGLLWGKPWWRGVTLVLAVLSGLGGLASLGPFQEAEATLLALGQLLAMGGVIALVAGTDASRNRAKGAIGGAVIGIILMLVAVVQARLRVG
jgi:hypothetical protein